MLIQCPDILRDIYVENERFYSNRIINLKFVYIIGKSKVFRNGIYTFHTIRFSHSKNHSTEWYFVNKEDRDVVYDFIVGNFVTVLGNTHTYSTEQ